MDNFKHIQQQSEGIMHPMLLFSHEVLSSSFVIPWTVVHQAPLGPWDFLVKNTGVCCHFLLLGKNTGVCWHLPNPRIGPRDRTHISCIGRQSLPLSHQGPPKHPIHSFKTIISWPILFYLYSLEYKWYWYFKKQIPNSIACIICTYFSIYL